MPTLTSVEHDPHRQPPHCVAALAPIILLKADGPMPTDCSTANSRAQHHAVRSVLKALATAMSMVITEKSV